jgi:hypothetical protein
MRHEERAVVRRSAYPLRAAATVLCAAFIGACLGIAACVFWLLLAETRGGVIRCGSGSRQAEEWSAWRGASTWPL